MLAPSRAHATPYEHLDNLVAPSVEKAGWGNKTGTHRWWVNSASRLPPPNPPDEAGRASAEDKKKGGWFRDRGLRGRQEEGVIKPLVDAVADDLARIINAGGIDQRPAGVRGN
jgi:hypothetical protein